MDPVVHDETSLPQTSATSSPWVQPAATAVFLVAWALVMVKGLFRIPALDASSWPEAALVLAATAATLIPLARELPAQNILLASTVIAGIGTVASALNAFSGIPFGPCVYPEGCGLPALNHLPWLIPCAWVIAILNARGVGRLVLRPWRKTRNYGYRLIGLTVLLALSFELGLEPFASQANHFWRWRPTRLPVDWYGAPLTVFLGWTLTVLLSLAFATPALMKRRPARVPPEYRPLLVWICVNLLFATSALAHSLPLAAALSGSFTVVTMAFAIRGARW